MHCFSCAKVAAPFMAAAVVVAAILALAPRSPRSSFDVASKPTLHERALKAYSALPLAFEANVGQTDKRVRFLAHGSGDTIFLTRDEAVVSMRARSPREDKPRRLGVAPMTDAFRQAVMHLRFVGADPASMSGVDPLPARVNYLPAVIRRDGALAFPATRAFVIAKSIPGSISFTTAIRIRSSMISSWSATRIRARSESRSRELTISGSTPQAI